MVDYQILFNGAIGLLSAIFGWFMHIMYDSLRELQRADFRLNEEIYKVSLLIAADYVKRPDIDKLSQDISAKFESIRNDIKNLEEKLYDNR